MNQNIWRFVDKHSTGKKVIFLFIITQIIYAVMVFGTIPNVMSYADEMKLLDMMPTGYDFNYVTILMASLGPSGRSVYLHQQIPLDMIYPLMFAVTYFLLLALVLKEIVKSKSAFYYLCFIPVLAGVFDYLENIGIISMLTSYPNISNLLAQTTNIFTLVKSYSTTVYFIVLLISIFIFLVNKLRRRMSSPQQ